MGVLLYLRLPQILGECGIVLTTAMIFVCYVANVLTILSVVELVGGMTANKYGELYRVLHKNLGKELGASLGIIYYLGKVIN
jgi:hypothetical protein